MDPRVERLLEISEPDFGFDPTAGGMAFAPVASAQYRLRFSLRDNVGPYDELPTHSNALREVVAAGADIVPALLDHLDDPRESACTVELTGMVYSAPHLDAFESGIWGVFKAGTQSEWSGGSRYAVPLGDLCYVALGQIVNRQYWALYYQPSLIQIVNSPVHCPSVAKQVRDLWSNCDAEFLFQSLCSDLSNLTVKYRRESAVTRLMFYYPERSIEPITRELFRPTYSTYDVDLVYEALWALQSEVAVSDLLHTVTPATLGGVADTFAERADRMPGFRVCEDILFATVAERLGSRETWPIPFWRQDSLIARLAPFRSEKLDEAVFLALASVCRRPAPSDPDIDAFALACARRLIHKAGFRQDVIEICESLLTPESPSHDQYLGLLVSP